MVKSNGGEGRQWVGKLVTRSPQAVAVEEAATTIRVLDFHESPPWLATLKREGLGGGGRASGGGRLRGSERYGSSGAERTVRDYWMGTQCQW